VLILSVNGVLRETSVFSPAAQKQSAAPDVRHLHQQQSAAPAEAQRSSPPPPPTPSTSASVHPLPPLRSVWSFEPDLETK